MTAKNDRIVSNPSRYSNLLNSYRCSFRGESSERACYRWESSHRSVAANRKRDPRRRRRGGVRHGGIVSRVSRFANAGGAVDAIACLASSCPSAPPSGPDREPGLEVYIPHQAGPAGPPFHDQFPIVKCFELGPVADADQRGLGQLFGHEFHHLLLAGAVERRRGFFENGDGRAV